MQFIRNNDLWLGLFVLAITAMLLLPLPTVLLDLLLVLNISISLLLLLVGLYMRNAIALLAFPTLLLLTTLFRLGLNVASTRLILSQADAGQVIYAFGNFLIRGEVIVGVIIFTIITVVNYIVIARGSSRVSEVAARFALDALPGKQMAIDADLRAGLLSPQQAEEKREELRKESQLYGSMDGAMKFVQGDAIAGFFIIFTNIIGGLYIGISQGMDVGQAVGTYTTLTVGDGLVSQIPALFVSICAGVVVTRVSSGKGASLAGDLGRQLFSRPATLLFSGFMLLFLGLLPVLPALPFLVIGAGFILFGVFVERNQREVARVALLSPGQRPGGSQLMLPYSTSQGESGSEASAEIFYDQEVLFSLYKQREGACKEWLNGFASEFYRSIGLHFPYLQVRPHPEFPAGQFEIRLNESFVLRDKVPLDGLFVEIAPAWSDIFGLSLLKKERHPLTGALHFWTEDNLSTRRVLQSGGVRFHSFFEYSLLRFARFLKRYPEEALSMSEVHLRLKEIEVKYPNFLADALDMNYFTLARITQVLLELVREDVNIYHLKDLLEQLAGYASSYGIALVRENEFELEDIVGYIRKTYRRKVLHDLQSERSRIKFIEMSERLQEIFLAQSGLDAHTLSISPNDSLHSLLRGLKYQIDMVRDYGQPPVCLLCPPELRARMCRLIRDFDDRIPVITGEELDASFMLDRVGVWE